MAGAMSPGDRDIMYWIRARNEASSELQRFGSDLQRVQSIGDKTAQSMALFAASIAAHRIGAGMQQFGRWVMDTAGKALEMATAFDKGNRLIQTQLDGTVKQFGYVTDATLNMAKTLPLPMDQIQEGLYDIYSSMDVTAKGGIKLARQFSQAAVAGNVDIRSSTRAAIGALNAYHLPLSETNDVLDAQFQLVRKGVGTYEEFIQILGDVMPSGRAAGQSLQDVYAALAFTTRNGLQASKAGISVARALDMISRPQYSKAIEDVLGVEVIDEATGEYRRLTDIITDMAGQLKDMSLPERKEALASVFGAGEIRANRFFNIALSNFKELNKMTGQFGDEAIGGAMGKAFDTMSGSMEAQLQRLKNHFNTLVTMLARNFFPTIEKFIDFGTKMLDLFEKLPDPVKHFAAQVLLLSGAFALVGGKILTFTGNLIGMQALLMMADRQWKDVAMTLWATVKPWAFMALKIAAVAAVLGVLIANWDKVRSAWLKMEGPINHIIALLSILASAVIMKKVVPALMMMGRWIRWNIAAMGAQLSAAIAKTSTGLGSLNAASLKSGAIMAAGSVAIYAWTQAFRAWQIANAEHQKNVEATSGLHQALVDQVKLGVRSYEENTAKIKQTLGDESLSWDERYQIVGKSLTQLNEWKNAGGEVINVNNSNADSVRRQIDVNKGLGHNYDWLLNKVDVFAGMSLAKFDEWRSGTVQNFNLVQGKLSSLAEKHKLTAGGILTALKKSMGAQVDFGKNWTQVAKRAGQDADGLLKYLQENFGAKAPAVVKALAGATDKEFKSIVEIFNRAQRHAERMSEAVSKDFSKIGSKARDTANDIDKIGSSIYALPTEYVLRFNVLGLPDVRALETYGPPTPKKKFARGGIIDEHIYGIGRSGTRYEFGERGIREKVTPVGKGSASDESHVHFHTYGKPDQMFVEMSINELEWNDRTRGYS